jgi:hypothetical protein
VRWFRKAKSEPVDRTAIEAEVKADIERQARKLVEKIMHGRTFRGRLGNGSRYEVTLYSYRVGKVTIEDLVLDFDSGYSE